MIKTTIEDRCPVCTEPLISYIGHQLNQTQGFSVECPNMKCGMADWGWGRTVKEAVNIFKQKCGKPVTSKQV